MDKILNGSTLYDVLSAIVPGYLFLLWCRIVFLPKEFSVTGLDELSLGIIIFVASYLVGLLLKFFLERLFSSVLRNQFSLMQKACKKSEIDEEEKKRILAVTDECLFKRNYYIHYYIAVNYNANSSIGTIEMQIAFIRSMMAVILLYIIAVPKIASYIDLNCNYSLGLFICLLLVEILITLLIFSLQVKVHKLVWEDSFYAEENKKNNKRVYYEKEFITGGIVRITIVL